MMRRLAWILDLVLGKRVYRRSLISSRKIVLSFPDGDRPATVEAYREGMVRSRWFPVMCSRVVVTPDEAIAIPGKHLVYSISYPGNDEELAIKKFVANIEKDLEQAKEKHDQ